ncbi:cation diffusion facilitator family transporter [Thermostichus sp. MS-CIW-19]|uniref:cation diffusion facilitator family transporter n=1 Tax=unclassified Synechococcus TaxID=2626047 RepID=UPI000069407F|nr:MULTISPECIES: cation diffusion facilitator family transporter [unclassified Synechococcus]ABC98704.1 cation transporter, cation diffusion facilitator (CDF) family [Synechococcus sp. JA-3-3Ab]PIK85833.1 cation transporter [Synechococcus sp. 63AY4M2]PIK89094.1 cation transporter [Synechococcus sp. 65AY6A5]PIK94894.1 cation transporter [Synechococcus sp. 60AY4M2]PIK97148.1 cation transporter [Synechococcus sp. 63AY4M1]
MSFPDSAAIASRRQRQVQRVLYVTLGLNLLVFSVKLILGLATGSLSLVADALHSVTDSASNILALLAARFSSPEPDEDHPYGRSKFEAIGALGIAAFLGVASFEILSAAVGRFFAPQPPQLRIEGLTLTLMLGVLGINLFVAVYERFWGRALASSLLLADARHTLSDVWVTLTVLLGLAGIHFWGIPWLDQVLAVPVGLLVFWSGWEVLRENVPFLTDRVAIPPKTLRELVLSLPGILDCHDITSRGIPGQMIFIEMHMVVEPLDVESAHRLTEAVEQLLQQRYGPVRVTIHLEPYSHIEGSRS